MRLLIAEDSMSQRIMLKAIVEQWGFEVVEAEDGEQAWEIMSQDSAPHLLLLDWEMPKLDGLSVCRRLRRQQSSDPPYIILLTARSDTTDIVNGLDAGANDYIAKPFNSAELKARLQVGRRMVDLQSTLIETQQQLQFQATHDALTGLINRGAVLESLEKELERARRSGSGLAIGLCDIDFFKNINDTHGHLVGDEVLREMARRFNGAIRPYDHIGRYGGEEFLLVIPMQNERGTNSFERVRHSVADTPFQPDGLSLSASISIGVALYSGAENNCNANELLNAADMALYRAKDEGRNRVVMATKPQLEP